MGGCLWGLHIRAPQQGVIVFAEADIVTLEFTDDVGMGVEVVMV